MHDATPAMGHNNPPDPIEEICAAYEADRLEAENWCDGDPVQNEAQMKAADVLRKAMRQWRLDLERGQKAATAPLQAALTAERDRWKPTIADAKRIEGALVAVVDGFKRKLAEEKRAKEQVAWEAANAARREAEAKARATDAGNLEQQREADEARQAAMEAEKAAQAAKRDQVKGLRTVTETVVIDEVALARHLWEHDRAAQVEFQAERARKLGLHIPGVVERRSEKRAY